MDFQALSTAYLGTPATVYDARRAPTRKWVLEDKAVRELLDVLPRGAALLDMPVGTGRFLKLYHELGLKVAGRDISPDMLGAAREKLERLDDLDCSLELADIRAIPVADAQFDCALSMRFLNWMDAPGLAEVLSELRRVSSHYLIVGVRHKVPLAELLYQGPNGWSRLFMRHLISLRRFTKFLLGRGPSRKARTIQHEREVVLRTFQGLGLRIDAARLIENARDGSDYCIYRLSNPSQPLAR